MYSVHYHKPTINNPTLRIVEKRYIELRIVGLFLLLSIIGSPATSIAAFLDLPKDADGWTVFTPSPDSRIIYISADGNDDTCRYNLPSDPSIGADPFKPSGAIQPCASYAKAITLTRLNHPDWILMKRGDTIYQESNGYARSGRSVTEPFFIGAYGESGAPPLVKVARGFHGIMIQMSKYIAVSGIEYYAYTRDPANPGFIDYLGMNGLFLSGGDARPQEAILVEGCKFRLFKDNGGEAYKNTDGIVVRRNVFLDNYSEGQGHSQGLYIGGMGPGSTILIEENIFDHNGWYSNVANGGIGVATMFNHNVYIAGGGAVTLKDNISLRSSSIGFKFSAYKSITGLQYGPFTADNNLIVDAEVGITMAGDNTPQPLAVLGATVTNNVITGLNRLRTRNQDIAWGIDLLSIDGGLTANNLIVHNDSTNSHGISHRAYSRNLTISDNVIYNFKNLSYGLELVPYNGTDSKNIVFTNNKIQTPDAKYIVYAPTFSPAGKWAFSENKYLTDSANGARFKFGDSNKTDAQWVAETGDNSTFEEVSFTDPSRSIETYMVSIGEKNTIEAFTLKCRSQNRYNWDTRFTAAQVNTWIRAGFNVGISAPPAVNRPAIPIGFKLVTN